MAYRRLNIALLLQAILFLLCSQGFAEGTFDEKHREVSLRMIGHELLLRSGDSSSRVLPLIKQGNQYKISFESDFGFFPTDLIEVVDSIASHTQIADSYIVEMVECETELIVYSFEKNRFQSTSLLPCKGRVLPKACYSLFITIRKTPTPSTSTDKLEAIDPLNYMTIGIPAVLLLAAFFIFWKKKSASPPDPNLIRLGKYQFDKRNSVLLLDGQATELSGKEADLLLALSESVNITVERQLLLNKVWGDEGDYIGRTLDVFISKLRKKLDADPEVKIVNIRGVGYKLVIA